MYYESAESIKISRKRALYELKQHGLDDDSIILTFDAEMSPDENGQYDAQAVLQWLGY